MFSEHSMHKAEIKNLKFITDEGLRHPKTAILTVVIPTQANPVVELLGYHEPDEIYKLIDEGQKINLDNCYINKFSLNEYRKLRGLDSKQVVTIKGFTARNAFFDTQSVFDFSYAAFVENEFSIEKAWVMKGKMHFNYSSFNGINLNFSNVHFKDGNFDFANVRIDTGNTNFKNTIFATGKKDFQYTDFGKGNKTFTNLEFNNGDVSFINTLFNEGDVSFKVARWGSGKVDFHYAKFGDGDKTFEQAEFGNGPVDFRTVEFGTGKVNFNRTEFGNGDVSFEGTELLEGKFTFKKASFGKGNINFELAEFKNADLSFDRTDFGAGNISFYNSKFRLLSLNSCHLDHYTDIRLAYCEFIDLSNTIVRDIIDLKPYEFVEEIKTISFVGMRLIGRIYIDWWQNHVIALIESQKDVGHRLRSEQYRTLKENFRVTGQYTDEDEAYVEFKRHEALADLEDSLSKNKLSALWMYPAHWFKLLVFDKAGLYATSPLRVIVSMVFAYSFFSLLYVFIELISSDIILETVSHNETATIVGKAFYYSFVTYFTIGYGDFVPMGSMRVVAGLEAFTGLFLMSYFTVAFVRKILR
jgi:hypothetical protein